MGLEEGLAEGFPKLWREQWWLAFVVTGEGVTDPAGGVAQGLGHLGDGVASGEEPDGVPAGAFHGVFAFR